MRDGSADERRAQKDREILERLDRRRGQLRLTQGATSTPNDLA
jgi:hypothetical protein